MPRCPQCHDTFPAGQFCPKDGTRLLDDRGDATPTGSEDPLIGQVLADRFRIVSKLGVGGMGTVYEAEHCFIKKRVALKLLRQEITSNPDALARFQREALAASTIGHDNIVAIDDFGRLPDGQVYLTMEYLDGVPLNQVIRQGPMPVEQLLQVMLQSCHGLAAAHAKGIIHRDMKPENIFLVDEGRKAKILDFGIAKVTRGDTKDTNLTKTGAIFGTPNYMAPEQALGKRVDHRADIYAMGIILYELLTGVVPFRSDSFLAILTLHVTKDPDPPSQAVQGRTVPLELERVAMRAIRKEPDQRYQDMGEMVSELLEARAALLGDRPLDSQLRVSKIMPPSSEQATSMAVPARDVARLQGEPASGNPTATAGELVGPVTPPRRRTGLVVGAMSAALLTGAGAVVAYHVYQGSSAGPDQPPVVAAKTPTVPDAARLPDAPRPEPRMVSVVVSSVPTGAAILRDGKRVGKTPEVLSVRTGEKMTLVLRREGYRDHAVTIETKPGQQKLVKEIRLASTRRRRRRHRPRRREPERSVIPHRTKPQPVSDHGDHGDHGPDTTVNRGTGDSSHVDGH